MHNTRQYYQQFYTQAAQKGYIRIIDAVNDVQKENMAHRLTAIVGIIGIAATLGTVPYNLWIGVPVAFLAAGFIMYRLVFVYKKILRLRQYEPIARG